MVTGKQAVDIVITTELIPGRPAPRLLTARDVAVVKPGVVIVDMAAVQGGNVGGTVPGRAVVTDNGVTITGYTDPASRLRGGVVARDPAMGSVLLYGDALQVVRDDDFAVKARRRPGLNGIRK